MSAQQQLPPIVYRGKIVYYTDMIDIASTCDTLTQWVDKQAALLTDGRPIPIAFDMEWPFTYQTGPGKSAVIQLCATLDVCYVFQISALKRLPAALLSLLYHPRVCLHGVNIRNDCTKLQRDFPEVSAQRLHQNCRDLGVWCNAVINSSGVWSMERLVAHICRLQINKDKSVRQSRWDVQPLTADQQLYAAIDVYISQVIFYDLEKREQLKKEPNSLVKSTTGKENSAPAKPTDDLE